MNYTEEQILDKAKKILKILQGDYFNENNIIKSVYDAQEELMKGKNKGKLHPSWNVIINEPIFDSTTFLIMSDETGEPLYFQTKHSVYEIFKNEEGTYYLDTDDLNE